MVQIPLVQYLRDEHNIINVTISGVKLDDGRVAFGFAYRSHRDPPNKATGGYLSTKRAIGMIHAAQKGVQEIVRTAPAPRSYTVLKAFLGGGDKLIEQLSTIYLPIQLRPALSERVEKILVGMDKKAEKDLATSSIQEE